MTWLSERDGRVFVLRVNVASGPVRIGRLVGFLDRIQWRVVVGSILIEGRKWNNKLKFVELEMWRSSGFLLDLR